MYIPKIMIKKIAEVFYDKPIQILNNTVIFDNEGGVISKGYDVIDTFKGNVSFSNCKKIQEEYGLDYDIDISITTNYNTLKLKDIIKYQGVIYNVTDILESDSHVLIVATKWRQ